MFWLLRKLFSLAILIAIIVLLLQIPIFGKTGKEYVLEVYHSQMVQGWLNKFTKNLPYPLSDAVQKNLDEVGKGPAMEEYHPDEEKELQKQLQKALQKDSKK